MTSIPTCPICSGSQSSHYATAIDIEYFTTPETFEFHRCTSCDIIFLSPMPTDRLNEIYPANYYSFRGSEAQPVAQRVKRWLDDRAFLAITREIQGSTLSALDVGGGNGWLLNGLRRAEPRIRDTTVVDIDPSAEEIARASGHDYHASTFERFETGKKFDVILMLNLIEHVADPIAVLRKAKTLLRPGGRIWIKTPNFNSLDAKIFRHRSWGGYHTPRHFVLFTRKSIIRHCESVGLEVRSCRYTQGAPFWTVSCINELRKLGICRVTAERPSIENPITPFFHLAFAAFDFLRLPFSKTSQVNIVLTTAQPE